MVVEPVRGLRLGVAVVVMLTLGIVGWATLTAGRGQTLVTEIAAGSKPAAPPFSLPVIWPRDATWPPELRAAVSSGQVSTASLRGHPAVINFWASWCGPCRSEVPLFVRAAAHDHDRVAFVGIDVQDLAGDALRFLPRFHVDYVSVRDGSDRTYRDYGLTGVPETFFLDSAGRVVMHVPGVVDARTLARGLRAIS